MHVVTNPRLFILVFFIPILFLSCYPTTGIDSIDPADNSRIPLGATWFARDISNIEGVNRLSFLYLEKSNRDVFELYTERFSEGSTSQIYDFIERFYVELTAEGEEDNIDCTVTGIKKSLYDTMMKPGDAGFSEMLQDLGYSTCEFDFSQFEDFLSFTLPSGKNICLSHELAYKLESIENLEHEGQIQTGTYREYVSYYPDGSGFRLFFRWSYSYTSETGAEVYLRSLYDAYGFRSLEETTGHYQCSIDSFTEIVYPRPFYSESNDPELFNEFADALGFTEFYEQRISDEIMIVADLFEGGNQSWVICPTPLD